MAIGQVLTTPESGWRRYDNAVASVGYIGTWSSGSLSTYYNSTNKWTNVLNAKVRFNFTGNKLRIISSTNSTGTWANDATIKIDGVPYTIDYSLATGDQKVVFEKLNLLNKEHSVEIINTNGKYIGIDAIDIDVNGTLLLYNENVTLNKILIKKSDGVYVYLRQEDNQFVPLGHEPTDEDFLNLGLDKVTKAHIQQLAAQGIKGRQRIRRL